MHQVKKDREITLLHFIYAIVLAAVAVGVVLGEAQLMKVLR